MNKKPALLAFAFAASLACFAQEIPKAPDPPRLVNDLADVLSESEEQYLEQKLLAWEDSTSNQLAIVLVKNLAGLEVSDYSVQLARKWKIGSTKNNGILLLAAIEDRKTRIEVGYGLEGRITDAVSRRILADELKPEFREGRYLTGLDRATDKIISAAAGEYKAEAPVKKGKKKKGMGWALIISIIIILYLISRSRGGGGGGFLAGMLMGNMMSGGRHSSWGDFSSGSGSFGGFGGGDFGGGGASGDW
jgi:uncharacterized protein